MVAERIGWGGVAGWEMDGGEVRRRTSSVWVVNSDVPDVPLTGEPSSISASWSCKSVWFSRVTVSHGGGELKDVADMVLDTIKRGDNYNMVWKSKKSLKRPLARNLDACTGSCKNDGVYGCVQAEILPVVILVHILKRMTGQANVCAKSEVDDLHS
jgi:hypothetical protein